METIRPSAPLRTPFESLHLFRFPFTTVNILITLMFLIFLAGPALLLMIPMQAMILRAIPVLYLSTVLYTQYMFVIVEYTSQGYQVLPKMSFSMIQPTHDHRLFKELVVIVILLLGFHQIRDPSVQPIYIGFALLILPLATVVITIEHTFFRALNPGVWWQIIKRIGPSRQALIYVILQLTTVGLIADLIRRFFTLPFPYVIGYIFTILIGCWKVP